MAHVIPTLKTISRPTYTSPALRRTPAVSPNPSAPAPATDFRNVLKDQSTPTVTEPASPPRTIGTVSPWPPAAVVTSPAPCSAATMAPTAQSLFGANPWSTDAGGTGPSGSYSYNHYYFATPATAAKVAQMLGGTVVTQDAITPYGPFKQNQPNQMVQMPDGRLINAGLVAGFYDHGYTQTTVDKMIAAEVRGDGMYS